MRVHFRAKVELGGKTATGLEVPPEVVARLAAGGRPPVCITVAGHTYRTTVATRGGRFLVPLSADNRAAAGLAAGDEVEVGIALDNEPRVVQVPPDLAAALDAAGPARAAFDRLSYSTQRGHVLGVEGAGTEQTRQRRIDKVVSDLGPPG